MRMPFTQIVPRLICAQPMIERYLLMLRLVPVKAESAAGIVWLWRRCRGDMQVWPPAEAQQYAACFWR